MSSSCNSRPRPRRRVYPAIAPLLSLFVLATLSSNGLVTPVSQTGALNLTARQTDGLPPGAEGQARVHDAFGKLPLRFEANRGQTSPEVQFLSRGSGYGMFLTSSEAVLALSAADKPAAVVRMKVVGADAAARAEGLEQLPTRHNYFVGRDPAKWRADIPVYAKVKYESIYAGIDLVYYGNQQQLEYDFVVAPGADPSAIRLSFAGVEGMALGPDGDLVLRTAGGEVRQQRPVIYQEVNGGRSEVAGRYVMGGVGEVGFELGAYDVTRPLVIDPVIVYSTFFGGSGAEFAFDITVGPDDSAYITGRTMSIDFPTQNATQPTYGGESTGPGGSASPGRGDAYVARLNAAGSALVYSTYLGGSLDERGSDIAVDGAGAAYITGLTNSTDFPTMSALQSVKGGGPCNFDIGDFHCFDAFVTKLSATGALVYSTYLGGNLYDDGRGIDVDAGGNAYITGNTHSTNFPTMNPIKPALGIFQDAYVTKLSATGASLIYSTYLGGTSGSESGQAITVDAAGNAYIAGVTNTPDFPVMNAVQPNFGGGPLNPDGTGTLFDAFVAKINAGGSLLLFSTYLGGSGDDLAFRTIGLDAAGNVSVAGQTNSINFPVANAIQPTLAGGTDAFVAKLGAGGSPLIYATYFGGSGNDSANNLATSANGNTYVVGNTNSANLMTVNALQATIGGGTDGYVMGLNASGSTVLYSSYIGTSGVESGSGVALNGFGNILILGRTDSSFFPVVNALQPDFAGVSDVYLIKILIAPETRGQCMNGGWQHLSSPAGPFRNQGECLQYLNSGK